MTMHRSGTANLPLHGGKAPRWLFTRMVQLARGILDIMVDEFGGETVLERLADPFWFQSLACVLGFDWHSSGTTTVTCGALREALVPHRHGIALLGGKGKAATAVPHQLEDAGDTLGLSTATLDALEHASRITAKIDSAAVQDDHQLYHHAMVLTESGSWLVIQQGMNDRTRYARRYHWYSAHVDEYIVEPHDAILGKHLDMPVLDMCARPSAPIRDTSVDLVCDNPTHLRSTLERTRLERAQRTLDEFQPRSVAPSQPCYAPTAPRLDMPWRINWDALKRAYEFQPRDYEALLLQPGIGPKSVRALALVAELVYGEKASWADPVKFSFAVGGKDGVPYPVDRTVMDETIALLRAGIDRSSLTGTPRRRALDRLRRYVPPDHCER